MKEVTVFKIHLKMYEQKNLKNTVQKHRSRHAAVVMKWKGPYLCFPSRSLQGLFWDFQDEVHRRIWNERHDHIGLYSLTSWVTTFHPHADWSMKTELGYFSERSLHISWRIWYFRLQCKWTGKQHSLLKTQLSAIFSLGSHPWVIP